jgi:uncharacterized protein (TIGR02453 family)
MADAPFFTPATYAFLKALKRNNNREWFAANKARYVADVEAPMQRFITEFAPRLKKISPAFVADPRRMGGSMFRIYRDTRFSADKSPFKTWIAARFSHETGRKGPNAPGFYLHLGLDENYGGGGLYHAEQPVITRVRRHIVEAPKAWASVRDTGIEIEGDRLKRPPAGYDAAHQYIEDIKRKDFYALAAFSERDVTSATFLDRYADACASVAPLMRFLAKALELRW